MLAFFVRRLLLLTPLLILISFGVVALVLLIPGDPARQLAGIDAPQAEVTAIREQYELDEPLLVQYGRWLGGAVRGDLGSSIFQDRPVVTELGDRLPVTLSLAVGALAVMLLIGVPAGILAGTRPGSLLDRLITVFTSLSLALPPFWVAMVLVVLFAVTWRVVPAIGYVRFTDSPVDWATHLYLPWFALGLGGSATLARQVRGSLVDVLEQDYIRTADAKGLPPRRIIGKHALKNAAIAPLTVLGIQFAYLLGGTVIIEQIFSLGGVGQYFFVALVNRDLPVIRGVVVVVALTFITLNLVVDVLYTYLNPKVRLG